MNILALLEDRLYKALKQLGLQTAGVNIKPCTNPIHGDYQCNSIISISKKINKNPIDLANTIASQLEMDNIAEKVEVARAGFLNIFLSTDFLIDAITKINNDPNLGIEKPSKKQTVVVDYSAPNVAKEMHVGHLRSTILGDAMVRILSFLGHKVIRQNHIGDWGTQFGMLVAYLEEIEKNSQDKIKMELFDLEKFYQDSKKKFDSDPIFADKSRQYVVKLQSGDTECLKRWKKLVDITLKHSQIIYKRLNVLLTSSDVMGESAYNDWLFTIIQILKQNDLLHEDKGAKVVFLNEFKNKEGNPLGVIVEKSDGGFLYATTDLAAIRHRYSTLNADRLIYYADSRQAQHFAQVFIIARKARLVAEDTLLEHHAFGMILGKDNKPFKSRSGDSIKLAKLLDEAEERAAIVVAEKSDKFTEEQKCLLIKRLAIAAIKYSDLSRNRNSDYVFDWDKMLSFEGNTAPYLLYAYIRICSIFNKTSDIDYSKYPVCIETKIERELALLLCRFNAVIAQAAKEGLAHLICNYLYNLSSVFMRFYEKCPINKDNISEMIKCSRLQFCDLTKKTLLLGFNLLGIEPVDKL